MWRNAPVFPPPPTIQQALQSCRGLTVHDLRQDPALFDALRRLRATTTGADNFDRAKCAPALIKRTDIKAIRGLTANLVVHDPELRHHLKQLRSRTRHLKIQRDARTFSAVGELGHHLPGPPQAAGKVTVASMGPGWLGPHRVMESYRRPTGPGNR